MSAVLKSPDENLARITIDAVCHDCKRWHRIDVVPAGFGQAAFDWEVKHRGHNFEFLSPKRFVPRGFDDRPFEAAGKAPWWLDYSPNTDFKIAYAASAAITFDLANLASSSTFLAGRESSSVDNSTNKYLDYRIAGIFYSGNSGAAGTGQLYYVGVVNDTPTWPDVFDGTDSAETVSSAEVLATLPLAAIIGINTSSEVAYPVTKALTIAGAFGVVPNKFGLFFAHNTTVNLYNNANNTNKFYQTGIYMTG